jgi:hypothetical protein
VEIKDVEFAKKTQLEAKKKRKLRAEAKSWPHFRDSYPIHLRAKIDELSLAVVCGLLKLAGLDRQALFKPQLDLT